MDERRCGRSGCRLSRYNTSDQVCGPCERASGAETRRVAVPDRVWGDEDVRDALARWDFGLLSRRIRERGSLRQEDMAELTGLSQGFLSMLEPGSRRLTSIDRVM